MMQRNEWDSVLQLTSDMKQFVAPDLPPGKATPIVVAEYTDLLSLPTHTQELNQTQFSDVQQPANQVAVSTSFFPGADNDQSLRDLILLSWDDVFFYVHSYVLRTGTSNGFGGLLRLSASPDPSGTESVLSVSVRAAVLNVALHAIHGKSPAAYCPTFEDIDEAVTFLHDYGYCLTSMLVPGQPLYTLFLHYAPLRPIELYATAAHYNLHDLAVASSSHLLALYLPDVSDELASRMGPIYLKRLFFLHVGRVDALKRMLLPPPNQHALTPSCDFADQKGMTRAWALASSYLIWDARPDLSVSSIETALKPLGDHMSCDLCQNGLKERVREIVIRWSSVKRTI